ncbi:hypothetical protein [Halobacillus dabanensis]|nr:hypothetical protein [Halobacillus dabanensis]
MDEKKNFLKTNTIGKGSISIFPTIDSFEHGEAITIQAFPYKGWEFIG